MVSVDLNLKLKPGLMPQTALLKLFYPRRYKPEVWGINPS
jgi:hypothetical protein